MRLLVGIDIGWSTRRRTCALATIGPVVQRRGRPFGSHVFVGLYFLEELVDELQHQAAAYTDAFRSPEA